MMSTDDVMMSETPGPEGSPGLDLKALYYVLFRHKWKILLMSLLGVLGAGVAYFLNPPAFQSEAKLVVRYVRETEGKFLAPGAKDSEIHPTESGGGAGIINTEREILTSFDLALQVADLVGPEKILGRTGGVTNRIQAAAVVEK